MRYLKCDKCGSYYELKEGESIDDFDGCECGGNYIKVNSLEDSKPNIKGVSNEEIKKRLAAKRKGLDIKEYEDNFCRYCGTKNLENAKFCVKCGSRIGSNICPKCGIENPRDAQFCKECGSDLKNRPQSVDQFNKSKIKKGLSAGEGILVCLFSPLAGIIGYLVWHDSKPQKAQDSCLIAIIVAAVLFITYFFIFVVMARY